MTPRGRQAIQRLLDRLAIASVFALPITLAIFDVVNLDFGFHLKAGEYIWLNRAIPTQDVFSYLAEGNRWVDSHWLFQLGLYAVHSQAGVAGAIALRVALVGAVFALAFRACHRREYLAVSIAIGVLVVFTMYQRFLVRPELVTFLFLAGFFYCLERFERRPRLALVAIPVGQVIWTNGHGLYPLGVALVAAYLAGDVLQHFAQRRLSWIPAPGTSALELRRKALLLILTSLAALTNGNGLDGILYPLTLLSELRGGVSWYPSQISELRPPFESTSQLPHPISVYKVLLAVSAVAWLANLRNLRLAHLLPYLLLLPLSLLAVRNMALFALVAGPVTVHNLNTLLDRAPVRTRELFLGFGARATTTLLIAAAAVGVGWAAVDGSLYSMLGWRRTFRIAESEEYPKEVVPHLAALDGRFFNCPQIGGYLIWKLYPEKQVALDGRWEIYGEPLPRYQRACRDPRTFLELADEYDISALVLYSPRPRTFSRMVSRLRATRAWEITLTTPNATVLERR